LFVYLTIFLCKVESLMSREVVFDTSCALIAIEK